MLVRKFKLRQLGRKLYEKGAINQDSAIPPSNFSKNNATLSSFSLEHNSQEIVQITDEGYFYLNLKPYLKFRREYNQRLFLLIANIVIVLALLIALVSAWFLNHQFFG